MLPRLFDHLAWADANARDALHAMPASSAEAKRAGGDVRVAAGGWHRVLSNDER
jgi:hypothetical protein